MQGTADIILAWSSLPAAGAVNPFAQALPSAPRCFSARCFRLFWRRPSSASSPVPHSQPAPARGRLIRHATEAPSGPNAVRLDQEAVLRTGTGFYGTAIFKRSDRSVNRPATEPRPSSDSRVSHGAAARAADARSAHSGVAHFSRAALSRVAAPRPGATRPTLPGGGKLTGNRPPRDWAFSRVILGAAGRGAPCGGGEGRDAPASNATAVAFGRSVVAWGYTHSLDASASKRSRQSPLNFEQSRRVVATYLKIALVHMLPSMSEILICHKYVKTYFLCTHVLHGSEICNDICQNLSQYIIRYIFRYTCCICIWFRCALRVWAYNGSQSQPTHRTNQGSLGHAGLSYCHSQRVSGDARTCPTRSPAEHTRGWVPLAMQVSESAIVNGCQAMPRTCPTRSPTADACYTRADQLLEVLVRIPGSPSGRIT